MVDDAELPDGWTTWHSETRGNHIIAFRPDVFDGSEYPAPCMPMIHLSNRPHRHSRPEQRITGYSSDRWYVTFFLEPDVVLADSRFETREEAMNELFDLAARFTIGDLDYRSAYQIPRERYLDRLDTLIASKT